MNRHWKTVGILITLLILSLSCSLLGGKQDSAPNQDIETGSSALGQRLRQWADSATASSEYTKTDWSASQATGAPDAECGDDVRGWASANLSGKEWLELEYAVPVVPTQINIHQNDNPSQIVEVMVITPEGKKYTIWKGDAEVINFCPNVMTIDLNLKETIAVNRVRLVIDYDALDLGWNAIDAVELVGFALTSQASAPQSDAPKPPVRPTAPEAEAPAAPPSASASTSANIPAPTGFLATPKYQAFSSIVPFETSESDLNKIMGEEGKLSTENWKPREDHANTYIYELGDGVKGSVSVITSGEVYKTSTSGVPQSMDITVNNDLYQQMTDQYKKDNRLPYEYVANLLGSPGFRTWYQLRDDNTMREDYIWYNAKGDYISGVFIDGAIRGFGGFAYVVK